MIQPRGVVFKVEVDPPRTVWLGGDPATDDWQWVEEEAEAFIFLWREGKSGHQLAEIAAALLSKNGERGVHAGVLPQRRTSEPQLLPKRPCDVVEDLERRKLF